MRLLNKIPYFIIAGFAWVVMISSCANQGMPTGGPLDSLPPVLVSTQPGYKTLNYQGNEVRLTFNEYIIPDQVLEMLVVSPPLTKRPTILTKSKTLIVQFNEELRDSATYSLDFKNSVVDNNERNPFGNLRFSFSTGDVFDSLRVAGRVINGFNLEPVENALIMLHKNLHDSAVYRVKPDYIGKADAMGLFLIDNIAPGKYHIFSVNDANSDLMYNEGAEEIAFMDTLMIPSAEFHEELDTLVHGVDSMLVTGHTSFLPGPFYLRLFSEDIFDQFLDSYKRDGRNKCTFVFNEPVSDTFGTRLINTEATDWYLLEPNEKVDSLVMWLTDTIVAKMDTLQMELAYFQLDSLDQLYVQKDTLLLTYTDKEEDDTKKKRRGRDDKEEGPPPIEQFTWITNLSTSVFDINGLIQLTAPEPVKDFDKSGILLYLSEDTLKTPLDFGFEKDSSVWRQYNISYKWEPEAEYSLEIDSAACENIYGITSQKLFKKFKIREEDYYGTIKLNMTGVKSHMIAQLLKNTDKEEVITEKSFSEDQIVVFDFLAPEKFKVKIIYDENSNGKWDTGSYQDNYQPERVAYINEVIKVRGNWDSEFKWELTPDPTFTKTIIDVELEEQKKKEAAEKAKKEQEREQRRSTSPVQEGSGNSLIRMQ